MSRAHSCGDLGTLSFPPSSSKSVMLAMADKDIDVKLANGILTKPQCQISKRSASDVRFSNRPFGVKHFQTVHVAVC